MQPAFGMAIAAAKTPNPTRKRWRNFRTHTVYGAGLYLAGATAARLAPVRTRKGRAPS